MESIKIKDYNIYTSDVKNIRLNNGKKLIINTINAHSYITANKDNKFREALENSDILLPDGEGIVLMIKELKGEKIKKIAGFDLHESLLELAEKEGLKCFYLGASESTLDLIHKKLSSTHDSVEFGFFSPPFKNVFSKLDNDVMIAEVNKFNPDILFVGMTAPKQEKWVAENQLLLNAKIICSIGAVFDFIAGSKSRAPHWVINLKLEWLYRSFTSWRLTKRYMYSTPLFLLELYTKKYFKR